MELVTIARYLMDVEAEMLRIRLEREGVSCHLANQHLQNMSSATGGFSPGASVTQGVWLQVRVEDAERAQAILSATSSPSDMGQGTADNVDEALETEAEAAVRCPFCGGENVAYAEGTNVEAGVIVGRCASCHSEWRL